MRAVVDVNVIVSAALSPRGAPAKLLEAWLGGHFEMVVSPSLLEELERVLAYRKIRTRIGAAEAGELLSLVRESAINRADHDVPPPIHGPDPNDDYLIVLAHVERAPLVTGDGGLLSLAERIPVQRVDEFLALLRIDD